MSEHNKESMVIATAVFTSLRLLAQVIMIIPYIVQNILDFTATIIILTIFNTTVTAVV